MACVDVAWPRVPRCRTDPLAGFAFSARATSDSIILDCTVSIPPPHLTYRKGFAVVILHKWYIPQPWPYLLAEYACAIFRELSRVYVYIALWIRIRPRAKREERYLSVTYLIQPAMITYRLYLKSMAPSSPVSP